MVRSSRRAVNTMRCRSLPADTQNSRSDPVVALICDPDRGRLKCAGIVLICKEAAMKRFSWPVAVAFVVLMVAGSQKSSVAASQSAPVPPASGQGKLIIYGDMALFQPPGHPDNCILRNRFKRGEPVGFRMFVADPRTGNREESAQLIVHVNYAGKTLDL